jgi:putative exosortase-associated protein (TIGR04073 family)
MRKILILCFILLCLLPLCSAYAGCHCDDEADECALDEADYGRLAGKKLGRGVIDMTTSWVDIPLEMERVTREHNPVEGAIIGFIQGTGKAIMRGIVGVYESMSFAVPPYEEPKLPEVDIYKTDKLFW